MSINSLMKTEAYILPFYSYRYEKWQFYYGTENMSPVVYKMARCREEVGHLETTKGCCRWLNKAKLLFAEDKGNWSLFINKISCLSSKFVAIIIYYGLWLILFILAEVLCGYEIIPILRSITPYFYEWMVLPSVVKLPPPPFFFFKDA